MNPVPPHHLLSAYLDGELSSKEREEVERLLADSPEARQELQELQHVGELLRQLPSNALPKSFASHVLDVCLTETGEFETETLTEIPAASSWTGSPKSDTSKRFRWWQGVAGLSLTLVAAALILALVLPDPANQRAPEVATQSPATAESGEADRAASRRSADEERQMAMAPANGQAVEELNNAMVPQPAGNQHDRRAIDEPQTDVPANSFANRPSADPRQPTVPGEQAGGIGGRFAQASEQVRVVKLVVGDRQEGLHSLEALLQQQRILRDEMAAATLKESNAADLQATMVAVYVETTEDELEKAVKVLRSQTPFQQVTQDAPIAMAQLEPILNPVERKPTVPGFGRAKAALSPPSAPAITGFGAARATLQPEPTETSEKKFVPKSTATKNADLKIKESQTERPKPDAASAEDRKPLENAPKPSPAPQETPEPPKKAPARPYSVAGESPELEKLRGGLPQANRFRPEAGDKRDGQRAANRRGRQTQFTLSKDLLHQLQKRSAEPVTPEEKSNAGNTAPPNSSGQRIKVLFILVDQPAKTEPAAPAKPSNNSGNQNGAA